MKITVEQYDQTHSIETKHDDVNFADFMELIRKVSYSVGYSDATIKEWFEE